MENSQDHRKPSPKRRASSLDRSEGPRKDSGACDCQCLSLHSARSKRELRRSVSDGATRSQMLLQPLEAQGALPAIPSPEETVELILGEQASPQDNKKDKLYRWAPPGLLKALFNFFLKISPEEPKEKVSKRTKGKEALSQPVEFPGTAGQPAVRKKSHDKKPSRKKAFGHKKHIAEETKGIQDQEAASHPEEVDLGPAVQEEAIIQKIVEFLQKIGDEWEEERLQTQQPEMALQSQALTSRKKSPEKKSSFRKAFSYKKHGFEEPKKVGAADVSSPESRLPKRPSFLPLCVGGHRPSSCSNTDLEEGQVLDVGSHTSLKTTPGTRSQCPEEESELDRASECKEFIQKLFILLQDAEEPVTEKRLQTPQSEAAVENPAPIFRKKSQEKRSSFKKAFSHKKHNSKEPKSIAAAGVSSPGARMPKRPSFLPLCVGGHRPSIPYLEDVKFQKPSPAEKGPGVSPEPSSQTRSHKPEGEPQLEGALESKEQVIQKLVTLLEKVDGQLGTQIRRYPSLKKFLYKLSDPTLAKLIAKLQSLEAHPLEPDKSLNERCYQFAASLANTFAGNNSHAVPLLGHYSWPKFPYQEAQQNITSPESQSPD